MTNQKVQIKIKERLNKIDSHDSDNFECWQIAEAFNKAQVEWARRQLHGSNAFKEGDEESVRRVDDLQVILTTIDLKGDYFSTYFETKILPLNYFEFKRVSIKGSKGDCSGRTFRVYQAQEADADQLLIDKNSQPSFEWGETFCTLINNKIRIYTNSDFTIQESNLIYYRQPREIQFKGCMSISDGSIYKQDQICEFKDDIVELIIDDACSILAGDIENMNQFQRGSQNSEKNN